MAGGADPEVEHHLELTLVGTEGIGGAVADVQGQIDADLTELILEDLADSRAGGVLLEGQLQLQAVGVAGLRQQLLGPLDILLVVGHVITGIADTGGRDQGVGRGAGAVQNAVDDLLNIDRLGDGLADADVREDGVLAVQGQVPGRHGLVLVELQVGVALNDRDVVHRQVVDHVHLAVLQGDGPLGGLGDNAEGDVLGLGLAQEVVVIGLEGAVVAVAPLHKLIGAAADRVLQEAVRIALDDVLGHDRRKGDRQVDEGAQEGGLQVQADIVLVQDLRLAGVVDDVGHIGAVDGAVEGVGHVLGGAGGAVVEGDVLPDLEVDGDVVHLLPALGHIGDDLAVLILGQQGREDVVGHHHGGDLLTHMGIHGGHIGGHCDGEGVGRLGVGNVTGGTAVSGVLIPATSAGDEGQGHDQCQK